MIAFNVETVKVILQAGDKRTYYGLYGSMLASIGHLSDTDFARLRNIMVTVTNNVYLIKGLEKL